MKNNLKMMVFKYLLSGSRDIEEILKYVSKRRDKETNKNTLYAIISNYEKSGEIRVNRNVSPFTFSLTKATEKQLYKEMGKSEDDIKIEKIKNNLDEMEIFHEPKKLKNQVEFTKQDEEEEEELNAHFQMLRTLKASGVNFEMVTDEKGNVKVTVNNQVLVNQMSN